MSALIVNRPVPMEKVRVITLKDYSETVFKTLQTIGVLHIEEAKDLKPVDREAIESTKKEVAELLSFVTTVLSYIPDEKKTIKGENFEVIYTRPFREISGEVKLLYTKANNLREKITKVDSESQKYRDFKKYLGVLPGQNSLRLNDLEYSGDFLVSRVFVIPGEAFKTSEEKLKKYLYENAAVEVGNETVLHAVAEARNQKTVEGMVSDAGGRVLEVPQGKETLAEFLTQNDAKIAGIDAEIATLRKELEEKVGEDVERLILLREALQAENDRLVALSKAGEARYITLIEGWAPADMVDKVVGGVRQSVDFAFVDVRSPEDAEKPPTKMNNSTATKPFQLIVELFGTPSYREWDPTPIVAYSFAIFFGIMTQDVIYALGIFLFGKYVIPKFVDNPNSEGTKLFQRILYISSAVSATLGLLTGSYLADFFPSVLGIQIPYVPQVAALFGNPITFIALAVGIGFVHVNIAHVFAFLVAIKQKNKGVMVTKIGFFLFQIFVVLFALASFNLVPALASMASMIQYAMYGGLGIMIFGVIMQNGAFGIMMWVFELTGLLGDALSYSRLAGVGMAGFYLGSAINLLANILRGLMPGPIGVIFGMIFAIIVLVVFHLINVVLNVQGGFVHSMRLCLVEFMLKFYEGGGSKYSPFKLKTTESLIVKPKAQAS